MKTRIRIDMTILFFIVILTGFLFYFSGFYGHNKFLDDTLDLLGVVFILKGTYFRMAARGYKKAYSQNGKKLVTTGLYAFMRNPMYVGSFLIGAGFVMFVWPWWGLFIFFILFYLRFRPQVLKEEAALKGAFGRAYEDYWRTVPSVFPVIYDLIHAKFSDIFPWKVVWSTKEKWGLITWLALAFVLETFQEKVVFGFTDVRTTMVIFISGVLAFILATGIMYANAKNTK